MIPAIADFLPHSMIEWEGRLATLLVLQGCNYRCPFCHSARFVPPGDPESAVPWEEKLLADKDWIDGVVISGGEPTIHAGLPKLLAALCDLGIPAKLDTNGSAPERLRELISAGLLQHVAMDVKAPLEVEAYDAATGHKGSLPNVLRSLDVLKDSAVSYELRTTVAPTVFTSDDDLLALARDLTWAERWYVQAFRPIGCLDEKLDTLAPTNPVWLSGIAATCRELVPGCRIRGGG
jgi:pyruvate formate lyase activating enzyme